LVRWRMPFVGQASSLSTHRQAGCLSYWRSAMTRATLVLAALFAAPSLLRSEILPTFSMGHNEKEASHIVVVNDAGKVLESWRGDLKPGDVLPIAEFHLKPALPIGKFGRKEGAPEKMSGKRMVLFLKRGGSKYGRGPVVGNWASPNFMGGFDVATLWIEDGRAVAGEPVIYPGPPETADHGPPGQGR